MAKDKTAYVCDNCGHESLKWIGRCPNCGEWNSFKEIRVAPAVAGGGKRPLVAILHPLVTRLCLSQK